MCVNENDQKSKAFPNESQYGSAERERKNVCARVCVFLCRRRRRMKRGEGKNRHLVLIATMRIETYIFNTLKII